MKTKYKKGDEITIDQSIYRFIFTQNNVEKRYFEVAQQIARDYGANKSPLLIHVTPTSVFTGVGLFTDFICFFEFI